MRALVCLLLFACDGSTLVAPPRDTGAPDPDGTFFDADTMPFPTTTSATVVVEPSDNGSALLDAVKGAKTSVHVTMYLLTWNEMIDAIIARKKAGLDVKVVLNQNFPDTTNPQPTMDALVAGGVPIVWARPEYNYTHQKTMIIDGKTAWIMTMNASFSSPQNREFLALDTDPRDVAEAEAIFAADFAHTAAPSASRLVVSPANARDRLSSLIASAQTTLDVESESLSDDQLVLALKTAKGRNVNVRVVVSDQTPSPAMSDAIAALIAAGIPVKKTASPYIHAKAIVVDGKYAFVGSQNLTANAFDNNRELGLILSAPSEVGKVVAAINTDFAAGT